MRIEFAWNISAGKVLRFITDDEDVHHRAIKAELSGNTCRRHEWN
jgi:hypothetical protein